MTTSSKAVRKQLDLFEFVPGKKAAWPTLRKFLPDVETALFFAKAYGMDVDRLSQLIYGLFKTPLFDALSAGDHSTDLQDYIVDTCPPDVWPEGKSASFTSTVPHAEFLPQYWEQLEVKVAASVAEVAERIGGVLDKLPSKEGQMMFSTLAKLNRQRPTIGVHQPQIHHQRVDRNLVVLDVSGSMSEPTVGHIAGDVVALSWKANAHLALVSNTTKVWEPGTYSVDDVLREAEYGGTRYETLAPLMQGQNWGTVVTVADYDSSHSAAQYLAGNCDAQIERLLDVSLVNRPTFLAECLGQFAKAVEPILVANTSYVLGSYDRY